MSVESEDGEYRASIPLEELSSKGVVVYGLADDHLPRERGGPRSGYWCPRGRTPVLERQRSGGDASHRRAGARQRARQSHPLEERLHAETAAGVVFY